MISPENLYTDHDLQHHLQNTTWAQVWSHTKFYARLAGFVLATVLVFALFGIGGVWVIGVFPEWLLIVFAALFYLTMFFSVILLPAFVSEFYLTWIAFGLFHKFKKTVLKSFDEELSENFAVFKDPIDPIHFKRFFGATVAARVLGIKRCHQYLSRLNPDYLLTLSQNPEVDQIASQAWGANWWEKPVREFNRLWLASQMAQIHHGANVVFDIEDNRF